MSSAEGPIILFDGVCGLCGRWIDFVLRHDRAGRFRFSPLQSAAGQDLLAEYGFSRDYNESIVLVNNGSATERSTAVLEILGMLPFPYSLAAIARFVPVGWRNMIYDHVARRRYAWFGKAETCRMPSPEERSRFL